MDILKQIEPSYAVCFSGHRPDRLPGQGNPDKFEMQKLIATLREQIEDAIRRGKNTFINGLMAGWDVLATEQVIALKEQYPHIILVTVTPSYNRFQRSPQGQAATYFFSLFQKKHNILPNHGVTTSHQSAVFI